MFAHCSQHATVTAVVHWCMTENCTASFLGALAVPYPTILAFIRVLRPYVIGFDRKQTFNWNNREDF